MQPTLFAPPTRQVVKGQLTPAYQAILTPEALQLLTALHGQFNTIRQQRLADRERQQERFDQGDKPDFVTTGEGTGDLPWQTASTPADLQRRRVEITGPVDRRMIINALNSGADGFMADLEDSTSPTWDNLMQGQLNLRDAVRREIDFTSEAGKRYSLNDTVAVLHVRPRGWHLPEKHVLIDGQPTSGALFDVALYAFHNAHELLRRGSGPYLYLPKLENRAEARLWDQVCSFTETHLGLPANSIKVTVLIETITAAFEMEEIIYELSQRIVGLNAGRWDYIFSFIKKLKNHADALLPDRAQVTMTVPFMRAYAQQLVRVCHRRGIHAIGGMSAYIPNRSDVAVNEKAFRKVTQDKELEAQSGFDGTWVAHPDLVAIARQPFDAVLGDKPHQKDRQLPAFTITAHDLLTPDVPNAAVTETGVRQNITIGIQYLAAWLRGSGAVALFNLMEDAATAEISRAQIWQWLHHGAKTDTGRVVEKTWYDELMTAETDKIRQTVGDEAYQSGHYQTAATLFDRMVTQPRFESFLTLAAYELL